MIYKVKISEEAELDLENAYQWYEKQVHQLGSEFVRMIDRNLATIQQNPLAYPVIYRNVRYGNVRRKLLSRFPFALYYVIQNNIIFVFACFHVKRDPQQWQRRIK